MALLVYVNDLLLTGNDQNYINQLKGTLDAKFKLKDLGSFHYFLGIKVARNTGIWGSFESEKTLT